MNAWRVTAAWLAVCSSTVALAQQVHVGGPFQTNSNGFFEQNGVAWGLRGPGFFFNMNNPAAPPFGNFAPGAGANFGFGFNNGGSSGFFNFSAGQGANMSSGMVAPSLTLSNGVPGGMFAGSLTPFVISAVPVVNGPMLPAPQPAGPMFNSPVQEKLSRMQAEGAALGGATARANAQQSPHLQQAQQAKAAAAAGVAAAVAPAADVAGQLSLNEIAALKAARDQTATAEIDSLLDKARSARALQKLGVAKVYFQQALRRASGEQKEQIAAELASLGAGS